MSIFVVPLSVLIVMMITPSASKPNSEAAATAGHNQGGRREGVGAATATSSDSPFSRSASDSHRDPAWDEDPAFSSPGGIAGGAASDSVVAALFRVAAGAELTLPDWETLAFSLPVPTPAFLKNGTNSLATSPGVWNRRSGSLASILATTAASSAGTSGRMNFKGLASIEWCA